MEQLRLEDRQNLSSELLNIKLDFLPYHILQVKAFERLIHLYQCARRFLSFLLKPLFCAKEKSRNVFESKEKELLKIILLLELVVLLQ